VPPDVNTGCSKGQDEVKGNDAQGAVELPSTPLSERVAVSVEERCLSPDQTKDCTRSAGRRHRAEGKTKQNAIESREEIDADKAQVPEKAFYLRAYHIDRVRIESQVNDTDVQKDRGEQAPDLSLHNEFIVFGAEAEQGR
jgi:hypothetical protein